MKKIFYVLEQNRIMENKSRYIDNIMKFLNKQFIAMSLRSINEEE